ncbi:hypothetical protein BS47DRAFT_1327727 [Hydnum rufescens UP504]|uniref:Heat shock protein 70 n=1 Tax=Hydnum rufescens UP504 TaxID=1448309 RepID=A0A9P6B249_9AGAM|nr:hypothetical protein BS47DRAFT_1327727 [Hydnum rufescens UP504]
MAAIGIDFGTSSSSVAIFRNKRAEVIPNEYGNPSTASYVSWDSAHKVIVGDSAKDTAATNPTNTVSSLKSILGRKFSDPYLQGFSTSVQWSIVEHGGLPFIKLGYVKRDGSPADLVSLESAATRLFSELKRTAELHLRTPITSAVVAVPVYYHSLQREALKSAIKASGLSVLRMTQEPSAILTSYALNTISSTQERNVALIDFGAGSLQVAIASIDDGIVELMSVAGNPETGGDLIDLRLLDSRLSDFKRLHGFDLRDDAPALRRLRSACERAKRQLSNSVTANIYLENLRDGIHYLTVLSRHNLESLCHDLFISMMDTIEKALKDAKLGKSNIHNVLLVGGTAKVPRVIELVTAFFGRPPETLPNPGEMAAIGSCLLAIPPNESPLTSGRILSLELTETNIGVETAGGVFTPIVKRNSTVPTKRTETFTTSLDNQTRFVIRVYEGNDPRASHNTLLVAFQIDNIPPFPRGSDQDGKNQIEVTVEIDESHVAKVFAFHAPTNRSMGYEITDRILKFDWSKQFPDVATSAPGVIPARQQLGARGKRPAPRMPAAPPTPLPITPPPDGRKELETYANKLREVSLHLNQASANTLDALRQEAGHFNGSSPSVYADKLQDLKKLCITLLSEMTRDGSP